MLKRSEHLAWCKRRALACLPDEPDQAFASMASDLRKHPETDCPDIIGLGIQLRMIGDLDTPEKMRHWIEGFN